MKIILLISFAFVVENAKFAVKIKKKDLCAKKSFWIHISSNHMKSVVSQKILRSVLIRIRRKGYGREYSKN